MLIEFIGPPGAGKSTIAAELADAASLLRENLDGNRRLGGGSLTSRQVARQRLLAIATQPWLSIPLLAEIVQGQRGTSASWRINLLRRNRLMRQLRKTRRSAVIEEGVTHACVLALSESKGSSDLRRWHRLLELPDLVVSVRVTPEVARDRVLSRAGVLSGWSVDAIEGLATRYLDAARMIESEFETPVIVIDSTWTSSTALAETLLGEIAPG